MENYNPKNNSPTLGKILSLLFLLAFLAFNPVFLWVTGLYSISAFFLVNSPNNYSKRFEPKIAKVENLESKIIEIELASQASQGIPTHAPGGVFKDSKPKESVAEAEARLRKEGNEKGANQFKNLANILRSASNKFDTTGIDFNKI